MGNQPLRGGLGGGVVPLIRKQAIHLDLVQKAIDGSWPVKPEHRQSVVNELVKILLMLDPATRKFKYNTRYRLKAAQLLMKSDMDSWKKIADACKLDLAIDGQEQGGATNNVNVNVQVNNVELNDDIRIARIAKIARDKAAAKIVHQGNGHVDHRDTTGD